MEQGILTHFIGYIDQEISYGLWVKKCIISHHREGLVGYEQGKNPSHQANTVAWLSDLLEHMVLESPCCTSKFCELLDMVISSQHYDELKPNLNLFKHVHKYSFSYFIVRFGGVIYSGNYCFKKPKFSSKFWLGLNLY